MSSLSLSKRLTNKPSRSYLGSGASDDGADGRSVASYRSRDDAGSTYSRTPSVASLSLRITGSGAMLGPGGFASSKRDGSMPVGIMRGSRTAASDVGGFRSYDTAPRLQRNPSIDSTGRRSVTFSDLNPALFDDDRGAGVAGLPGAGRASRLSGPAGGPLGRGGNLEVMSDIGGYGRPGVMRTPSIASSIIDDNNSDAGSTATRRSVRRGSRSERLSSSASPNITQWHNSLGGAGGLVKTSSSNPLSSIVKRKGSTRIMDLAEAQPSRRYSSISTSGSAGSFAIPSSPTKTSPSMSSPLATMAPHTASELEKNGLAVSEQKSRRRINSASSSPTHSPPSSEAGLGRRSSHSGISLPTSTPQAVLATPIGPQDPRKALGRSASTEKTSSKKLKTAKLAGPILTEAQSSPAGQAPTVKLHSSTLRNNLLATPPPSTTNTRKVKPRSAEQIVEALSKAGLLDRVMEVVNEADEDEASSGGEASRRPSLTPAPLSTSTENTGAQQPALLVTSATFPDLKSGASGINGDILEKKVVRKYQSLQQLQPNGAYSNTGTNGINGLDPYFQSIIDGQAPDLKVAIAQAQTPPAETGRDLVSEPHMYNGMSVQDIINRSRGESTVPSDTMQRPSRPLSVLPPEMRYVDFQTKSPALETPAPQQAVQAVQAENQPSTRQPRPELKEGLPAAERPLNTAITERDAFFTPEDELASNPLARNRISEAGKAEPSGGMDVVSNGDSPVNWSESAAPSKSVPDSSTTTPVLMHFPGTSLQRPVTSDKNVIVLIDKSTALVPSPSLPLHLETLSIITAPSTSSASRILDGTLMVMTSLLSANVYVRLTWDTWTTYEDIRTSLRHSSSSISEYSRHHFSYDIPSSGRELEVHFALKLVEEDGRIHWDNNSGTNYSAKIPAESLSPLARSTLRIVSSTPPFIPPRSTARGTPPISRRSSAASSSNEVTEQPGLPAQTLSSEDNQKSYNLPRDAIRYTDAEENTNLSPQTTKPPASQSRTNGYASELPISGIPLPPAYVYGQGQHRRTPSASNSVTSAATNEATPGSLNNNVPAPVTVSIPPQVPQGDRAIFETIPLRDLHPANDLAERTSTDSGDQTSIQAAPRSFISVPAQSSPNMYYRQTSATESRVPELPTLASTLDPQPILPNDNHSAHKRKSMNGHIPEREGTNQQMHESEASAQKVGLTMGSTGQPIPPSPESNGEYSEKVTVQNSKPSGVINPTATNSTMRCLTLTVNASPVLNRSFFRNNANTPLRQNPSRPSSSTNKKAPTTVITCSKRAPVPQEVRSDQYLVQVLASAIDFWDRAKVDILSSRGQGNGFIPGRAFVGRVIESGNKIDSAGIKTGDLVYGLNDLKKSGALGEYLCIDQGLLSVAPHERLSLEQIASVALSGIAAIQAMEELCTTLAAGSKLVILNAHEGVGAIALQLVRTLRPAGDLCIVAHYPRDFADGGSLLKAQGVSETLVGEAVFAMQSLKESSCDAILDSIGGRRLYDSAKHILRNDGYFVTTVGDALSVPTATAQWRVSLKAFFGRKEKKKRIGYWFPSIEQDQRPALDRLRGICEAGQLKPVVNKVFKYEDGATAFKGTEQAVIMLI